MKNYIAIVKTSNNKVDKLQDYDEKAQADAHVVEHGGFVVDNPGGQTKYWVVNESNKTVSFDKSTSDSDEATATIMGTIKALEAEVTPRRVRDAFADPAWMLAHEAKIKTERDKL